RRYERRRFRRALAPDAGLALWPRGLKVRGMKLWKVVTLAGAALLVACAKAEKPQGTANVAEKTGLAAEGSKAPPFDATAHTGEHVSLTALRGKPVVLYF